MNYKKKKTIKCKGSKCGDRFLVRTLTLNVNW